jgi:hypothetical protein
MENILPKSGFDMNMELENDINTDEIINIQALLTVFIENAIKNAEIYTLHANRNIITSQDISYSLKAELFLFLARTDNEERAEVIATEYRQELKYEYINNMAENMNNMDMEEDEDYADSEDYNETEESDEILSNITDDTEPYTKSVCNCENCLNVNNYSVYWNTWTPTNEIEILLCNAIQKIDSEYNL